ncbi:DUF397 domain-containing protein [Streptomyces sp. NPDC016675]|uniref:DUF397 domain-containing protein n=1 Tax=Streptomyces sp. NPDC016675 TaxID=3364970 RepID=UPI0036FCD344
MTSALKWFKSSYSGSDEPDCVEAAIACTDPTILVRDSKDTTRPHLTFTGASWTAFVHTVATADRPA